jgi:FHS family glucose/mannose:H+ symporter-like MFS transporter
VADRATPHGLIACLCTTFVAVGSSIAALGPALPEFAGAAGVDVSSIGMVFSALFAGMLTSQVTAGLLLERIGTRTIILAALGIFAFGTFGVASATRLLTLLPASAVLGAGYGLTTVTINLVASRLLPGRPAFVLNLINVLYGSGAVLGPLLASVLLRSGGQARWVPAVGGVALIALIPWAWQVLPEDEPPVDRPAGRAARAFPVPLLLIGALVFLYGGVEAGFGGWAATYVERTLGVPPARAALLTSAYWFAYVSGRVLSTALTLRLGPATVLHLSLAALAVSGTVLLLSVGHQAGTTTAIVMLGAATGPIWPSMFGVVATRFADRAAFAVSTVAALGSIGAMLLPWTMGLTLPLAGGRVLAATPMLLAIGMWVSYRASERR